MIFNTPNKNAYLEIGTMEKLRAGKNITGDKFNKYLFNADTPFNFGVKVQRIFTSMSRFYPKMFTNSTVGSVNGNYFMIDNSFYQWDAIGDISSLIRITKDVTDITENSALIDTGTIGQGQKEFYIQVDTNHLSTNAVLLLDNNDFMLIVTNDGVQEGLNTKYSVRVLGSDESYGIPTDWLLRDRTVTEASSTIPDFGTPAKPGLPTFGTNVRYRNVVGKYGREFTVDENFVKQAIRANKSPEMLPSSNQKGAKFNFSPSDFVNGAVFSFALTSKDTQTGATSVLKPQGIMSFLEMKVEDLIAMDREIMCHFGKKMQLSTATDTSNVNSANTKWLVAPGLRSLLKMGHYKTHTGTLSTDQISEYLHAIYMTRVDEADRRTTFRTGELGKIFLHKMVEMQAQGYFNTAKGDQFISQDTRSTLPNALKFGYQWTEWIGLNGIVVSMLYDMLLDDPYYCRQNYQPNSSYTVDSARLEVLDYGDTNAVAEGARSYHKMGGTSNVSMIIENDADVRRWRIGAYDPYSGWVAKSQSDDTSSTYHRTISGSPVVWDVTRIGAYVYEPIY